MTTLISTLALTNLVYLILNRYAGNGFKDVRPGILVDGLAVVTASFIFLTLFHITARPVFSLLLSCIPAVLVFMVNRIKSSLFFEPLTFMDVFLVPQLFTHPRFYLPYIFPLSVAAPTLLFFSGLAALLIWEPALERTGASVFLLVLSLSGVLLTIVLAWFGPQSLVSRLLQKYPVTLQADEDIHTHGFMAGGFLQLLWHRFERKQPGSPSIPFDYSKPPSIIAWKSSKQDASDKVLPHIILIQAESFFDLRKLHPQICPDMLENFDELARFSSSGNLGVSSSGAYTMRTEFSVLTGMAIDRLGTDGLNPYREASRRPVWSMARHLSGSGYAPVLVHPFDTTFFKRHKVMPNLGFEKIVSEAHFTLEDRFGPYVSDMALGRYINEHLKKSDVPCFVFAVTIEAHGPWDANRLKALPPAPGPPLPPWAGPELEVYVRHLKNTDRMLGFLAAETAKLSRPVVICLYGDHPGSIPRVYARTGYPGNFTPYIIWPASREKAATRSQLLPEELGGVILDQAGIPVDGL